MVEVFIWVYVCLQNCQILFGEVSLKAMINDKILLLKNFFSQKLQMGSVEMKFISWNVNGLRACMNKGFKEFMDSVDADVFAFRKQNAA